MEHEARVETSRMELSLMATIGAASTASSADRRTWNETAKKVFDEFAALSHGFQKPLSSQKDEELIKYYEKVIKTSAPKIRKTRTGLAVSDLPDLGDVPNMAPGAEVKP